MAKKFRYVCLGILALAVAFHLGARYGEASIVDHATTGIVAVYTSTYDGGLWVLLDNGDVWLCRKAAGWGERPNYSPPIPVSEMKFWTAGMVISNDNELLQIDNGQWSNYGAPTGLVGTQSTTWAEMKVEFGME